MFKALLEKIAQALDSRGIRYMVIGGQAVLLHGEPRFTRDVDITLGVGPERLPDMFECAREAGLRVIVDSPARFVQQILVLPCEETATGIRVDFIFSLSSFERQAIERASAVTMGNTPVRYATAEDLVILKTAAGRPRDLEDVHSILLKQPHMDVAYVRQWLRELQEGEEKNLVARFEELWKAKEPL